MKILKFIWKVLKTILISILLIFGLVGIWFIVNGGAELFEAAIKESGFINFIKDFFVSMYEGIKRLIGG